MADDYVKRSDVHKAFQPKYAPAINRTFAAMIDSVPAADVVEVRHAHWIVEDGCAYCSDCRNNFKKAIMTHSKFCPMCGAKMDGGQDDG